ncbi:site-2 protease family protein [Bremerella sp. T1]|uniref:site-2 protease family protein n=1 Tax=Bremerella sp. TYQ1 TaxID=3119568 RepID=UPI001CCFFF52|nr:site-2 protease family protein [Bremerella volcania]UBM35016.1 site-2 protease family protein [Bremerella volcania]
MESRSDDQAPSQETSTTEERPTMWERDSVEFSSQARRYVEAPPRQRRVRLPVILFIATCLSTFLVGMTHWEPVEAMIKLFAWSDPATLGVPRAFDPYLSSPAAEMRRDLMQYAAGWKSGFLYMAAMLGILFAHEMGHFLMALRYRVPASLPYFIPVPISPIGTFGAVIGMDGMRANRKQLFDIGLAGPLAGLVVAVPVLWYGVSQMDLSAPGTGAFKLDLPLAMAWMMQWFDVPGYEDGMYINQSQLNPFFMAGWVGLLVTGLNMIPVSQLDGGHVTYTLFGKKAHWIARAFLVVAVGFIITYGAYNWSLMLILVILMRPDHPPTSDDSVPIGWFRYALGTASLTIPLLCFPPMAIVAA